MHLPKAPAVRRALCPRCGRAQSACICAWVCPTAHQVEVLLLQHPLEVACAKGSARLLHLSLARSRLEVGEAFAPAALEAMLYAPWGAAAPAPVHTVLLYPETAATPGLLPPAPWPAGAIPAGLRLVLLDGTWRKSRKMLYANPALQGLPRLALRGLQPAYARLRRAQRPGQLSTLEACCAALAQLEGLNAAPLLAGFDGFVAQQSQFLPPRLQG